MAVKRVDSDGAQVLAPLASLVLSWGSASGEPGAEEISRGYYFVC